MQFSRRRLLSLLAPGLATLASCGLGSSRPTVNIRDHGAIGDGVADDSPAIIAATAALKSGHTLYFPAGSYRFARRHPPSRAAIAIAGISDVAVDFSRNAELLMDNLDDGSGTSHGILVSGRAAGIALRDVTVRWKTRPARRSFGDGIRVVGFPADGGSPPSGWTGSTGSVADVRILDCHVRSSPQAGVIMMGVSGIKVDGLRVQETMADGLHFNACRRATVRGHRAVDTGDDGLALVTYYADSLSYDNVTHTFSMPDLSDWSNADFAVTNVRVHGGRANGVRLAGAHRVRIGGLEVSGKQSGAGVIADSAAPGVRADWHYVASRDVRLNRVRVRDCEMGVHLLARPSSIPDRRFIDFGLDVSSASIRQCSNWAVRAESLTAQRARGLSLGACRIESTSVTGGNGGVGLENLDSADLADLSVRHAEPVTVFSVNDCAELRAGSVVLTIDPGETRAAAAPAAAFRNSDGRIATLTVRWPGAPDDWQPIRFGRGDGRCGAGAATTTVAVTSLSVEPASVKDPVNRC